ncbi:hypothetical protein SVAN01_11861 [Stagonosporopsis vannaccii]|nr:hypothetical protein SVAN01_11861 [Stagonosporopsis vannaccii]
MSRHTTFKTTVSSTYSHGLRACSAGNGFTVHVPGAATSQSSAATATATVHTTQVAASASTTSLSAVAKAITRFLFGDARLPNFISQFNAFFTGFVTGAVAAPALYAYLTRNHGDRSKIQLAVFHIMRLFQARPDYAKLLEDPQQLLALMEPEVMAMVDKHLTKNEAGKVVKELKREHAHLAAAEHVEKRLRTNMHSSVKQRQEPYLTPAYAPTLPGFLPASHLPEEGVFATQATTSTFALPEEDTGYETDVNLTTPVKPIDVATSGAEGLHEVAKDKGKSKQIEVVASPHAPQHGSYGLNYDDKVIFSSSSSDDEDNDEDLRALPPAKMGRPITTPPSVVRMLRGKKCLGTSLSPIQASPSGPGNLLGAGASALAVAAPTAMQTGRALPFAQWTTSAELEFSSSSSSSSSSSNSSSSSRSMDTLNAPAASSPTPATPYPTSPVAVTTSPAPASPPAFLKEVSDLQKENSPPTPSSSPRRSPSRHFSPLADITGIQQSTSSSVTPPTTPFKRGRSRGRTGGIAKPVPSPATPKNGQKEKARTPGTRKITRQTAYQGAYGR